VTKWLGDSSHARSRFHVRVPFDSRPLEYLDEQALNIYTDGSSYSGPRRGGVGILYVTVDENGHERVDDYPRPGFAGATNNQMELQAAIEALAALASKRAPVSASTYKKIVIWTDSIYLVDGFNSARFTWPSTGWTTQDGNPVANAQQWQQLVKLASRTGKRVDITWVEGHKHSKHNKAADKLAKKSAKDRGQRPVSVTKVRRKKSPKSVERGSVGMHGQQATIHVINDAYLPVQRCNQYTYEVMSRKSEYFQNVDVIFSDAEIYLSAGHTYRVRFNSDIRAPRIVKVFAEVG
jgi:ribonuclease HI